MPSPCTELQRNAGHPSDRQHRGPASPRGDITDLLPGAGCSLALGPGGFPFLSFFLLFFFSISSLRGKWETQTDEEERLLLGLWAVHPGPACLVPAVFWGGLSSGADGISRVQEGHCCQSGRAACSPRWARALQSSAKAARAAHLHSLSGMGLDVLCCPALLQPFCVSWAPQMPCGSPLPLHGDVPAGLRAWRSRLCRTERVWSPEGASPERAFCGDFGPPGGFPPPLTVAASPCPLPDLRMPQTPRADAPMKRGLLAPCSVPARMCP